VHKIIKPIRLSLPEKAEIEVHLHDVDADDLYKQIYIANALMLQASVFEGSSLGRKSFNHDIGLTMLVLVVRACSLPDWHRHHGESQTARAFSHRCPIFGLV
jgi:hypothetical protein